MNKIALSLLLISVSYARAAPLIGTSQSFSTTNFCKSYKCVWDNKGGVSDGIWIYKTKYGDYVSIIRRPALPSGKVITSTIIVAEPDAGYYPNDNESFKTLQKELFGKVIAAMPKDCYYANSPMIFAKTSFSGKVYKLGCMLGNGMLTVGIGTGE